MVQFENIGKVFPNGYIGLADVSFRIEPGTLNYLVGESGAGKTTIMRMLIREILPSSGEIYLEGEPLSQMKAGNVPYLRRKVGVVFQDYKLIAERTVGENISLALEIIGTPKENVASKIEEVLGVVGLEDKFSMFPSQLSGGELQRVAIARALVMTPKILFADEPTGNLDQKTGLGIAQLLQTIAGFGTTVIIATHDPNLLKKIPGRELHLQKGRLVHDSGAVSAPEPSVEVVEVVPEVESAEPQKHAHKRSHAKHVAVEEKV